MLQHFFGAAAKGWAFLSCRYAGESIAKGGGEGLLDGAQLKQAEARLFYPTCCRGARWI